MRSFRAEKPQTVWIELTPLMDVLFILLLFFILTASPALPAVPVELPRGETGQVTDAEPFHLGMTALGQLYWEGEEISETELLSEVKAMVDGGRTVSVILQGDKQLKYEQIFTLMDRLRAVGVQSLSLGHRQ